MYCYIIIIIISLLYYYISKKYENKNTVKSIESIENKNIKNKNIENKNIENKINLELPPPSYEEVIKDAKKSKYKLCPFFNT